MKKFITHSRRGFTLVELMIAITIFAIMSTMTILIYFNISETSRRMQISREISETARQITERINQEMKKEENTLLLTLPSLHPAEVLGIDSSGIVGFSTDNNMLTSEKYLIFAKPGSSPHTLAKCEDADKNNPSVHCGLFWSNGSDEHYNLVDSFREEADRKRVKISDLRFMIAGEENGVKKITLKMTLELTKKSGVPDSLIRASKMNIQTTISSEKF